MIKIDQHGCNHDQESLQKAIAIKTFCNNSRHSEVQNHMRDYAQHRLRIFSTELKKPPDNTIAAGIVMSKLCAQRRLGFIFTELKKPPRNWAAF